MLNSYTDQARKKMFDQLHQYKARWHQRQAEMRKKSKTTNNSKFDMTDLMFDRWFLQSFRPPSPTNQDLVMKKLADEHQDYAKELLRRKKKAEEQRREYSSDDSADYSDSVDLNLHA